MGVAYGVSQRTMSFVIALLCCLPLSASSWQQGYNFRKKIQIAKSKAPGSTDLPNFVFLLSIQDPALQFIPGDCQTNRITGFERPDICFTTGTDPEVLLHAQVDRYDPATGRLICWINLPVLAVSNSATPPTSVYIYYGATAIHNPYSAAAVSTWEDATMVLHMNPEPDLSVRNAASTAVADRAIGNQLNGTSYPEGKIGTAVSLTGMPQKLTATALPASDLSITVWVKCQTQNTEQVIVSSLAESGGYELSISREGNAQLRMYNYTFHFDVVSNVKLVAGQWYAIAANMRGKVLTIYINGEQSNSTGNQELTKVPGGQVSVGSSSSQDRFFTGVLDELRIQHTVKSADVFRIEYLNQSDPASCYTLGAEERSAEQRPVGLLFTGAVNADWMNPANWNTQAVPGSNANVIIAPGTTASILVSVPLIQKLVLQENAVLVSSSNLQVACTITLRAGARIALQGKTSLRAEGDLINDGMLIADEGTVRLDGDELQHIQGAGNMKIFNFTVQKSSGILIHLLQPVYVSRQLDLKRGIINTHGNLTLGLDAGKQTAQVMLTADLADAEILGAVTVEKYIQGGFSPPGTARGWRLLSSPVFHTGVASPPAFDLQELMHAIFVTGKGGAQNGFDDSPLNGNTIYSHNPALSGALSDKYQPLATITQKLPLGDGYFLFSRGSRLLPDAFLREILSPPFINPDGYVMQFRGELWTGPLVKQLYNPNRTEPGDGFNLLGNPYPFPLRWGSLQTQGISPFVWIFNPVNQSYEVSDDPNYEIGIGTGFFVRVNPGLSSGNLTFSASSQFDAYNPILINHPENTLTVTLSRDAFSEKYKLVLDSDASDSWNSEDAEKIGTGIVNIAGLSPELKKLAIDRRSLSDQPQHIRLSVQGQLNGRYVLHFNGFDTFRPAARVTLEDTYNNRRIPFTAKQEFSYAFDIDKSVPNTEGDNRFVLHIETAKATGYKKNTITVYPNPFTDLFYVKSATPLPEKICVKIRDVMGNLVLSRRVENMNKAGVVSFSGAALNKGVYFLELADCGSNTYFSYAKLVKQ